MKKILPFLFVTISLFPMQGDDLRLENPKLYQSHLRAERQEGKGKGKVTIIIPAKQELSESERVKNGFVKKMFKDQLIVDLQRATGLSKDDIYLLKTRCDKEIHCKTRCDKKVHCISYWIETLPLNPSTWTNFYSNTVNQYYSSKIKKDLSPIFGHRSMQVYQLNGAANVNKSKENIILMEVTTNLKKILEATFCGEDTPQLETDKKLVFEIAKAWLEKQLKEMKDDQSEEKQLKEMKDDQSEEKQQSLLQWVSSFVLNPDDFTVSTRFLSSYNLECIKQLLFEDKLIEENNRTLKLYKEILTHTQDQLKGLKDLREKERLQDVECLCCFEDRANISPDDRRQLACCKQFICKECLDLWKKPICPGCQKDL